MVIQFLYLLSQCWPVKQFIDCFEWFVAQLCGKWNQQGQISEFFDITTQLTKYHQKNSQIMAEAIIEVIRAFSDFSTACCA